jgi:hypothetical protein
MIFPDGGQDHWTMFRYGRMDTGPKLVNIIDALPEGRPPRVPGAHLLMRRQ